MKANYLTLPGWKKDTQGCKSFEELPTEAQNFIKHIEKLTKLEVTFVSTNAELDTGMLRTRITEENEIRFKMVKEDFKSY